MSCRRLGAGLDLLHRSVTVPEFDTKNGHSSWPQVHRPAWLSVISGSRARRYLDQRVLTDELVRPQTRSSIGLRW
jgi:hypothetical protein